MKMEKKSSAAITLIFLLFVAACAKPGATVPVTSPPTTVSPPVMATPVTTPAAAVLQPVTTAPTTNSTAKLQGSSQMDVLIRGSAFEPSILSVPVGTSVTWTNKDGDPHAIKCDLPGTFNGLAQQNGGTFSFTFTKAGTFNYYCDLHDCMIGTIIVN